MKKIWGSIVLAICCILIFATPAFAADLGTPQNLAWQKNATATATWDAVDGANYYYVTVSVYSDDVMVGSKETGTADTSVDVQQEVRKLIYMTEYRVVQVSFSVQAAKVKENGEIEKGAYSDASPKTEYTASTVQKLTTPTNLTLDPKTLIASWDAVPHGNYYLIDYQIDGVSYLGDYLSFSSNGGYSGPLLQLDEETKRVSVDISEHLKWFFPLYEKSGKDVKLSFSIAAYPVLMVERRV